MPIPKQRDPDVTARQLADYLARRMPAAREVAVANVSPPQATGFSTDTLLFDATWKLAGRRQEHGFVARVRPTGYAVFPEYDIGLQYRVVRTLGEKTDIPVPKVHWLEEEESILGAAFYVMDKIEGRIPGDNPPYHAAGWVTEVSAAERAALWWDGLDVLARIHQLDWKRLGLDGLDRRQFGAAGLDQQLNYYAHYFQWATRGRENPIAAAAFGWLERNRPEPSSLGLCWGDSRIGNMIFKDGHCVAVLDWEMVTLGDPIQDLAWWLFLDRHHSEGIGVPRLEGFPSHEETVARYEQLTGRKVTTLRYYEIFAAFRFAVIMMRVAQMMVEYEVLPRDSDLETNNIVTQLLEKLLLDS
jgi:aminoglycoside phosphotransferase (APT) family kinase protein